MTVKKSLFGAGLIVVAAGVVVGAIFGGNHLLQNSSSAMQNCPHAGTMRVATIKDNAVQPARISGKRCDTLKIVNLDKVTREIGFGSHEHHTPYDGVAERLLSQGDSFTVTLNQTGEYHFHDHFHDEVAATFVVSPS